MAKLTTAALAVKNRQPMPALCQGSLPCIFLPMPARKGNMAREQKAA